MKTGPYRIFIMCALAYMQKVYSLPGLYEYVLSMVCFYKLRCLHAVKWIIFLFASMNTKKKCLLLCSHFEIKKTYDLTCHTVSDQGTPCTMNTITTVFTTQNTQTGTNLGKFVLQIGPTNNRTRDFFIQAYSTDRSTTVCDRPIKIAKQALLKHY